MKINSKNQITDLITKLLAKTLFEKLYVQLRLKTIKLVSLTKT